MMVLAPNQTIQLPGHASYLLGHAGADNISRCAYKGAIASKAGPKSQRPDERPQRDFDVRV